MALLDTIIKSVDVAFNTLRKGKIAVPAILYMRPDAGAYDPETNTTPEVFAYTVQIPDAVPTTIDKTYEQALQTQQQPLLYNSIAYLIRGKLLPIDGDGKRVEISPDTDFLEVDGVRYKVYDSKPDPARATYTILVKNA